MESEILANTDESRRTHVLSVADFAARLAVHYCIDEQEARTAGLLHDITKSLSVEQQLKLCEKYGILPTSDDLACPQTLHALTGAAVAKAEYGASDEVCAAIRLHATGGRDMTILDKIIYIADKCELSRDYEGVEAIRKAAFCGIDEGMSAALRRVIVHLTECGRPIHYGTIQAYNGLFGHQT